MKKLPKVQGVVVGRVASQSRQTLGTMPVPSIVLFMTKVGRVVFPNKKGSKIDNQGAVVFPTVRLNPKLASSFLWFS